MNDNKIREKAFLGIKYLAILNVANYGLGLIRISLLARMLTPTVFGIFALAMVLNRALDSLSSVGTQKYIIQKENISDKLIGGVWFFNIIRGAIMALLIVSLGPIYSQLIKEPSVFPVLMIIALAPLIRGTVSPGVYLAERQIKFHLVAIYEFMVNLFDAGIVISLAVIFRDVRALAWGVVVTACIRVLLSFLLFDRPGLPRLKWDTLKELIGVGKHFIVLGIGSFIMIQADNLIVGVIAGPAVLGLYSVAKRLAQMPLDVLRKIINRIALPVFSRVQTDKAQLRRVTGRVLSIQLAILFPLMIILFTLAEPIVMTFFGDKWIDAIPILQALVLMICGRGLVHVVVPYIIGTGNFTFASKIKIVEVIVFLIGVTVGTYYYGGVGAALGSGVGYLVAALIRLLFVCRHSQISIVELGKKIAIPIICLLPGIVINPFIAKSFDITSLNSLILFTCIYAVTYFAVSWFLQKEIITLFKNNLLSLKLR